MLNAEYFNTKSLRLSRRCRSITLAHSIRYSYLSHKSNIYPYQCFPIWLRSTRFLFLFRLVLFLFPFTQKNVIFLCTLVECALPVYELNSLISVFTTHIWYPYICCLAVFFHSKNRTNARRKHLSNLPILSVDVFLCFKFRSAQAPTALTLPVRLLSIVYVKTRERRYFAISGKRCVCRRKIMTKPKH